MKKNNLQFVFDSSFNLEEMLLSLQWCIYELVIFFFSFVIETQSNRNFMNRQFGFYTDFFLLSIHWILCFVLN